MVRDYVLLNFDQHIDRETITKIVDEFDVAVFRRKEIFLSIEVTNSYMSLKEEEATMIKLKYGDTIDLKRADLYIKDIIKLCRGCHSEY